MAAAEVESLHVRSLQISAAERPIAANYVAGKTKLGYRDDDELKMHYLRSPPARQGSEPQMQCLRSETAEIKATRYPKHYRRASFHRLPIEHGVDRCALEDGGIIERPGEDDRALDRRTASSERMRARSTSRPCRTSAACRASTQATK